MVATTDIQLFANNKSATLNNDVAVPDTSLVLTAGQGAAFPSPAAGQFFAVTVQSTISGAFEVCYCTARAGDVLSVERAQEGTTAQVFLAASSVVQMRLTKGTMEKLVQRHYTGADSGKFLQVQADGETLPVDGSGGADPAGTVAVTGSWTFDPRITIYNHLDLAGERRVEFLHETSSITMQFTDDAGIPGTIPFFYATRVGSDTLDIELRATNSIGLVSGTVQLLGESNVLDGGVYLYNALSPPQLTSNQDDYSPTLMSLAALLRLTTSALWSISGFATGSNGRYLDVTNIGTSGILFLNESGSSIAANRFKFGYNILLPAGESLHLLYDGGSARWRALNGFLYADSSVTSGLNLSTSTVWYDDFIAPPGSSTANNGEWFVSVAGIQTTLTAVSSESGHPGIVSLSTYTSAVGRAGIAVSSLAAATGNFNFGVGRTILNFVFRIPVLPVTGSQTGTFFMGFLNRCDAVTTAGAWIELADDSSVWKFRGRTVATSGGSSSTTSFGATAVAGTWYNGRIEVNAAGTSIQYFLDGVSLGTLTTNIPSITANPGALVGKLLGATAIKIDMDVMQLNIDGLSARWVV